MKKFTYEEVKEYIEQFGYKLLSDEYVNARKHLEIECDKGHKYEVTFSAFKNQNQRCPYCSVNAKLSYSEVKDYIENEGYKLLSDEYKNANTKLLIECNKGHKYEVRFNNFKDQGQRCPICFHEKRAKELTLAYEHVKQYIENFGYKLLSKEYINTHEKLLIRCPLGHEFEMIYGNFQQGKRCPKCKGGVRLEYKYVKEYIESFGYKLLSTEYKNNHTKLSIKCPNNHEYKVRFNDFQNNKRCPICNVSKGEQRIINWLEENNIKYIYDEPYFNDLLSPLGNPLRPDFIIEDRKIWIEYDGEFHYKNKMNEDCYKILLIHDEIKNKYAKENNWKLIRIPYWDFENIEKILIDNLEEE